MTLENDYTLKTRGNTVYNEYIYEVKIWTPNIG